MEKDNKKTLFDYLKKHNMMSLATCNENNISVCTVYYAMDDSWNFYVVTPEETTHAQHVLKNSNVACSVADTTQDVVDTKIGAQIYGNMEKITDLSIIKAAITYWNNINIGISDVINFDSIKNKAIESRIWKITPTKIKFFNESLYGNEESEVFSI